MADASESQLPGEKGAPTEPETRQRRNWGYLQMSGKFGLTTKLPETLGFYDLNAVRKRQKDYATEPSLTHFVTAELTRGYFLEHNEAKFTERREKVYTCMRIPKELEKLMIFGFFLCMDAFLYVFTLLPLRVLLAVLRLLTLPCCGFRGTRLLQPAHVCDILKASILVLSFSMTHYLDYSMMYHLIRGQSIIKLYIIYNMLEVADRLFSSFGQDILDALYWTATEPKNRKRDSIGVIPHFIMAVFYVFFHTILIMIQASTLNVAFNSHNKSLLTIMMSSNFVEIKGSVFKKFGKNNLFQMSNSDYMWGLVPDVIMVIISEVAVDVVKHAFITKFNDISADVYSEYRASLAFDLVSSRQKNACTDYSDSVARRMGFIPLPVAVLLIRVLMNSVKVQGALSYTCVLLFYLGLVTLKLLNSIVLLGKSCVYVKRAKMEDKLFERASPSSSTMKNDPSRADKNSRCRAPSAEAVVEHIAANPGHPPPSSSSVTSQPTPRTDLFPTPTTDYSCSSPSDSPSASPPETEEPRPPPAEDEEETQGPSQPKHRTLLDIDRFTLCGNRID
ncbi:Transmembrane anterior posterior transformation protein 1 -like protein [Takifugu flavidus]|uniref:Transmembrane anterior posterior transformation protein 1-like protein n=1 Tax=Takifugu flavidus TaxID=433684 RepID=A0A5C6MKJ2_9TELE|nr:Transmembrane anterior posterior transformation protein 1 -like protein [Takifugu flavidus]